VLHDELHLRTSSPRRQFVMADATATENDQLSLVVQPRSDGDAVCGTEAVIDMSVILGHDYDEFPAGQCPVCESFMTRACRARYKGFRRSEKSFKLSQFNQPGSTADCRDCYLISSAMECFRDTGDVHISPISTITFIWCDWGSNELDVIMRPDNDSLSSLIIFQPESMRSQPAV
jgi:hypothetical protein